MHLKISAVKWRPSCPGGDELKLHLAWHHLGDMEKIKPLPRSVLSSCVPCISISIVLLYWHITFYDIYIWFIMWWMNLIWWNAIYLADIIYHLRTRVIYYIIFDCKSTEMTILYLCIIYCYVCTCMIIIMGNCTCHLRFWYNEIHM